jgi:hypothetical protein
MKTRLAVAGALALSALSFAAAGDSSEGARSQYAGRLERAMLKIGMSAEVAVEQTKNASSTQSLGGKFPKLIVFSYLSKSLVFNLITEGKVLDGAKEAGFQSVVFLDRGDDGLWTFDLTKPGSCARGLCWPN